MQRTLRGKTQQVYQELRALMDRAIKGYDKNEPIPQPANNLTDIANIVDNTGQVQEQTAPQQVSAGILKGVTEALAGTM